MVVILAQVTRIGTPFLGVLIPLLVLAFSFIVTWLLYRHFSKQL